MGSAQSSSSAAPALDAEGDVLHTQTPPEEPPTPPAPDALPISWSDANAPAARANAPHTLSPGEQLPVPSVANTLPTTLLNVAEPSTPSDLDVTQPSQLVIDESPSARRKRESYIAMIRENGDKLDQDIRRDAVKRGSKRRPSPYERRYSFDTNFLAIPTAMTTLLDGSPIQLSLAGSGFHSARQQAMLCAEVAGSKVNCISHFLCA